jgi:hypothetical protein
MQWVRSIISLFYGIIDIAMLQILHSLWTLLAALVVLGLPGLAWQLWLSPRLPAPQRDPLEQLADALGIGVSAVALAGLLLFALRARLDGWAVATIYMLLAVLSALGIFRTWRLGWRPPFWPAWSSPGW